MAVTIKDVAKLANTSIATVSRVLNNASNLTEETKAKVLEAIEKLDYKPNRIAQSLSGQAFNGIGVVSTRSTKKAFTNPYYSTILQAIGEVCESKNYEIMLNGTQSENEEYEKCMSMVSSRVIQGLIFLSARSNSRLISKLTEINFAFVVIGNILDNNISKNIFTVDTDNFYSTQIATEYLIEQGHKNIAFLHSPLEYVVNKERLDGFLEAHKKKYLPVNYSLIVDAGYTIEESYNKTIEILNSPVRPTAIVTTDDMKAMGVYKAAKDYNIKIPRHLSVIGHNNFDISSILTPPLSTVNVPIYELGTIAAEMLFEIINSKISPKRVILPTELIIRDSCGTPHEF